MPTAKNRFQILNLHPEIYRKTNKKKLFLMDIYPNFTKESPLEKNLTGYSNQ